MPHRVIIGNLQKKIYYPFYLLHGTENYYIDKLCDYFQDLFFEDEGQGRYPGFARQEPKAG